MRDVAPRLLRYRLFLFLLLLILAPALGFAYEVERYAGGGVGDGGPIDQAYVPYPVAAAMADGSILLADADTNRAQRVDAAGRLSTIRVNSFLATPDLVTSDAQGNVYWIYRGMYSPPISNSVTKRAPDGTFTQVGGGPYYSTDVASEMFLGEVGGIATDSHGNLYVSSFTRHMVFRADPQGGIARIAGMQGYSGHEGDGGSALLAKLDRPGGLAIDDEGRVFIVSQVGRRIRVIDTDGVIRTYGGGGNSSEDGTHVSNFDFGYPRWLALASNGDLYVYSSKHTGNGAVFRVDGEGRTWRVAGRFGTTDEGPMSEESGPARDAILSNVRGISVDPQGRVLVSVARGIWRVESDGTFRRHIGFGQGDGAPRREIRLDAPEAMARDAEGNIAVFSRATIRRLGADGSTSTLAGKHLTSGHAGDGGPAANAMLGAVRSLAYGPDGSLYLAEFDSHRVRRIDRQGNIRTVAGNGQAGTGGDGGPATGAQVGNPEGLAVDASGNLLIAASGRIRRVAANGTIYTLGGGGAVNIAEGVRFQSARFYPTNLAYDPQGRLHFSHANSIYRVDPDGVLRHIAGGGSGYMPSPIEIPARELSFRNLDSMAFDARGDLFVAGTTENGGRMVRISADGMARQVFIESVDGGPLNGNLDRMRGMAIDPAGAVYFTDFNNDRLLRIVGGFPDNRSVPGTPPAPIVYAGNGYVEIHIAPPDSDGGSPITHYSVVASPDDGVDEFEDTLERRRIITGLQNNLGHSFYVFAFNEVGRSQPSPIVWTHPRPFRPVVMDDVTILEGNGGRTLVNIPVTVDRYAEGGERVLVSTTAGSAIAGMDFIGLTDVPWQLPADPGTYHIPIEVNGDTQIEGDESFTVSIRGGLDPDGSAAVATVTVLDDDTVDVPEPPPHARDDRRVVVENGDPILVDVLANDSIAPANAAYADVAIVRAPVHGAANLEQTAIRYAPPPDWSGVESLRYRLCDGPSRCSEAEVTLFLQPAADVVRDVASRSGHFDLILNGLRRLEGLRIDATPLVAPHAERLSVAAADTSPSPWNALSGTGMILVPFGLDEGEAHRLRVEGKPVSQAGDIDLYVGVDADGNGVASQSELRCMASLDPQGMSCDVALVAGELGATRQAWVLVHNRSAYARQVDLAAYTVPMSEGDGSLVGTAPGRLPAGATFPVRVAWQDTTWLTGQTRFGYLRLQAPAGEDAGTIPVLLRRTGTAEEPFLLTPGEPVTFTMESIQSLNRIFFDVPAGTPRLTLDYAAASARVGAQLIWDNRPGTPESTHIPASQPDRPSGGGVPVPPAVQVVEAPNPGRWYVLAWNYDPDVQDITLGVDFSAQGPEVRPGSYFNPARPGSGLFLYPAGNQWAGLWYTYAEDSSPTWYYLQGPASGAGGVWTGDIYRAAWDGSANHLTRIGMATVAPSALDAFTFSYTLDGLSGSEPMTALGRGCPSAGGMPQDLSSHWFDPAHAGTGYSVQMWENYEYFAAFIYDSLGVPRFLAAEGSGFGGAQAVLALQQLRGSCPTCAFAPSQRSDVGTLLRRISGGRLDTVEVDVEFAGGVPGLWSSQHTVELLGGPGSTQGCTP